MTTVNAKNGIMQGLALVRVVLAVGLLLLILNPVHAADSFIVLKKSVQDYGNTMADVESSLEQNGFTVKFVQRVDVGLAKAGYHLDKYRIVFFMPNQGVASILSKRSDLADMFPLKVTVYREKGKVYVFGVQNASLLDASVPADIRARFQSWDKQIDGIVRDVF